MSYDGGIEIKVDNGELLKILKDHVERGTFKECDEILSMIWMGKKYKGKNLTIKYDSYDFAPIEVCPQSLDEVLDALIELFDTCAEDYGILNSNGYKLFKEELNTKADIINSNYTYVYWDYEHADTGGFLTGEHFSFDKGKESYVVG